MPTSASALASSRWRRSWKWRWFPSPVSGSVRASRIALSALWVVRWYSEIATSGPASAANSHGVRCQSTTSMSAVDAISVNGMIVQRTFERISLR